MKERKKLYQTASTFLCRWFFFISFVFKTARRTQLEGEQAMEEAMQYNAQMEKRELDVQRQGNGLKLMEENIAQVTCTILVFTFRCGQYSKHMIQNCISACEYLYVDLYNTFQSFLVFKIVTAL